MKPAVALFVAVLALAAIIGTFCALSAYPQDPCYHRFADKRAFLSIPNFWNVLSNVPFLVIGVMLWKRKRVFALGLIVTAFGSGFYHWIPNDSTLFLDRVGIVVTAMALVSLLVEEYAGGYARISLIVSEAIGVGSLIIWYATGDLRLYGVVQFFPGLLIIALPLVFRPTNQGHGVLTLVLVFYAIAKLCETYDAEIYRQLYVVSGHTLKHIAAAASTAAVWLWLVKRQPVAVVGRTSCRTALSSSPPPPEPT
jgi:hypothetical protein